MLFRGPSRTIQTDPSLDYAQLATEPACAFMRLYHPNLPWFIDVRQSNLAGITVYDIMLSMWQQILTPITGEHYWNEDLNDEDRDTISNAFMERCGGGEFSRGTPTDPDMWQKGVCRVDFLGKRVVFCGLVRGKNGNWEMKIEKSA